MKRIIQGILFDSGRVLNGPSTGNWWIPPRFFAIVNKKRYRSLDKALIGRAFQEASAYLSKQSRIRDMEEEFDLFLEFYWIFSQALPELELSEESIWLLATDMVYNGKKYRFFDDALEMIPCLSRRYRLAVVSDAWPSLDHVFREAGLRQYFSSFVLSSHIGVTKPYGLMFTRALEALALQPDQAVLVDDNPANCEGARKIGIPSILLCRDWRLYWYHTFKTRDYPVVSNLQGVMRCIQAF